MVARLRPQQRSGRFIRHATVGAVACSVVLPVLEFARITAGSPPGSGRALPALAATAGYLPLHVRHVWYATRGSRPPGGGWTLTVMAAVIVGALAVVGTSWLTALHALAVSTLIVVRPPWSIPLVAGMVAAPAPLAIAFGDPEWAPFHAVSVVWRGAVLFVLLWLIGATRRLEAARQALAEEAVTRERLRIDGELRRTLSSALEEIAERGRRAGDPTTREPAVLQEQLRALAERSPAGAGRGQADGGPIPAGSAQGRAGHRRGPAARCGHPDPAAAPAGRSPGDDRGRTPCGAASGGRPPAARRRGPALLDRDRAP
jgi:two-component system sensor histidine kinase DesK